MSAKIDLTTQTYNQISVEFDESNPTSNYAKQIRLFKKLTPGLRVVDLGCGTGQEALLFIKNGFDYTGIDSSKEMLKIARKRAKQGKFKLMNLYNLILPKNRFDCFWAAAVLLHIPKKNIGKVLSRIGRSFRSGALGFISIKEKKDVDEMWDRYYKKSRLFAFYKLDEFKEILYKSGFMVIKSYRLRFGKVDWLHYFVKKI